MPADIEKYVDQLRGEMDDSAFKASDALARIGTEEVVDAMIELLQHPYAESRIIAARTLGLTKNNAKALQSLMDAVKDPSNKEIAGDLLMALEGFDMSDLYVELFRLYLNGTFKVSTVAKGFLDFEEFDISARTIKKAEKHWNHYVHNAKHDDAFELKKSEVDEMLADLKSFLDQS